MINPTDVVAYLIVLGYQPALDRISSFAPLTLLDARQEIMGCLVRIMEALEYSDDPDERGLLELIRYREKLNGFQDYDHPQLASATRSLAKVLCLMLEEWHEWHGSRRSQRQHWD